MMLRTTATATAAVLSLSLSALPAIAAEAKNEAPTAAPVATERAEASMPLGGADWVVPSAPFTFAPDSKRPAMLPMLYVSFAALQAYDGYSTRRGLALGGHEANRSMQAVANHSAALWAVKAGITVGAVVIAERVWKQNKVAAIAMMVAANSVAAIVASHNARVLKQLR